MLIFIHCQIIKLLQSVCPLKLKKTENEHKVSKKPKKIATISQSRQNL